MLLAVDIGNSNIVFGVFEGDSLLFHFRIETRKTRTEDEYAALLHSLFALHGVPFQAAPAEPMPSGSTPTQPDNDAVAERLQRPIFAQSQLTPCSRTPASRGISACILATVVPPILRGFQCLLLRYLGIEPVVVGPGTRTGMPILYENPREVGADRIINAVAAYERYRSGCLVVDFGTATTFDVITPKGEYLGGAIAPGIGISADALFHAAAKLPRVELTRPRTVIGRNTVNSMQSGLIYGYVGLVDGIVERMRGEADFPLRVIATGGLAQLLAKDSRTIEECDELLTLTGLRIIYDRERRRGGRP
jgi:type III pantothenate kinase